MILRPMSRWLRREADRRRQAERDRKAEARLARECRHCAEVELLKQQAKPVQEPSDGR